MKAFLATLGVIGLLLVKALPLVKGIAFSAYRDGTRGIVIFAIIVACLMALGLAWRALKAWIATRSIRTV